VWHWARGPWQAHEGFCILLFRIEGVRYGPVWTNFTDYLYGYYEYKIISPCVRISLTLKPFFTLHVEIWSSWAQNLFLAEKELESRYFLRYCLHHCSLTSANVEVYLWIIMQWEGCHLPLRSMFCFWCKLWLYAYYTFA
jgi:hypothetical protein